MSGNAHGNYSVSVLTATIIGNSIDSLKCALKLCEMKRWKSTVLLLSFLTIVLVSCVTVLLAVGDPPDSDDVPLHHHPRSVATSGGGPASSSSSHSSVYPTSSRKSSRSIALAEEDDDHDKDDTPELHQRHNYRKRFTDAIKGVFSDLLNGSSSSSPSPDVPVNIDPVEESTENNSSRLKRQLDFGGSTSTSTSSEEETFRTTLPSVMKYTPPSKRPFVRVIRVGGVATTKPTPPPSSSSPQTSSSSASPRVSSSSEETAISSEEGGRGRGKYRKTIRRFRPAAPQLQRLSSREKYDVSREDEKISSPEDPRKNFTLEVVQVERKVVRKEDSHIPPHFKKGNYNIEPRLLKVSKKEGANRPQVVYKKGPRPIISQASPPSSSSAEAAPTTTPPDEGKVVVKLHPDQLPDDVSDEDLKDYHDGHSTFGSKGNFTHTILSRNVAGFLPNSGEERARRTKSDRTIVIEKGRVTERYPEKADDPPPTPGDVYAVPGGRTSSSTENYNRKQEAFPFTRTAAKKGGGRGDDDRTSPAIKSTFEELYKQGHPGVVPASKQGVLRKPHPLSDPYGDDAIYSSPFKYNPLVDDPPLKFDPESDRFYGEPVPDNKEKLAQSNSPEPQVNRNGELSEEFRPTKRDNSEEETKEEAPTPPQDSRERGGFYYGRAYNPPDYATEYDTEPAGNTQRDGADDFDFSALEEGFGPESNGNSERDNDFFDFPEGLGGVGGGRGGEGRFRPRADGVGEEESKEESGKDSSAADYEEEAKSPPPPRRPPPPPPERDSPDYVESNNDFGFGPPPHRGKHSNAVEDDEAEGHPDIYDNGFIHTLKQFDEEIKKLQEEERQKLLHSTALPDAQSVTEHNEAAPQPPPPSASSTSGYKKDPPLIITSPGPLEPQGFDSPGSSTPRFEDASRPPPPEEEDDEVTEGNPFFSNSREDSREEGPPNRSAGAEEEEEDAPSTSTSGFGLNDYSTESSSAENGEKKKK